MDREDRARQEALLAILDVATPTRLRTGPAVGRVWRKLPRRQVCTSDEPIVQALFAERIARNLSQRDVGLAMGCSNGAKISGWECGLITPGARNLRKWAAALGAKLALVEP